jgi:hypothetical protein
MHSQVTVWIETLNSPGLFELGLIATVYTGRRVVSEDAL